MKKLFFPILLLYLTGSSLLAQSYPDSLAPKPSDEVDYARNIISALTNPAMNGRGYARNGDKDAANFIVQQMQEIDVQPVDGSFLKPFKVSVNTFPGAMSVSFGTDNLVAGTDFWVEPSSGSLTGTFKAIYITRKQVGDVLVLRDKIRDAENGNGVLLIDNSSREGETPEQTKRINGMIEDVKKNDKINLKGVVIYNPGLKLRWNTSAVQSPRAIINVCRETADLNKIKDIKLAIDATLTSAYETQNVVGMIKGSLKPDSFIVIASHYDHLGVMGKMSFPGANNGASGVAAMLSLARHFQLITPRVSVLFVALGGDELGNAGAHDFIKNPPVPLSRIKLLINFDLMGNGSQGINVVNAPKFESQVKQMQQISTKYKLLPMVSGRPSRPGMSAHNVFDDKGIPAMFIYSVGGSMEWRNLNDTAEALPLTKFAEIQNLMVRFLETVR